MRGLASLAWLVAFVVVVSIVDWLKGPTNPHEGATRHQFRKEAEAGRGTTFVRMVHRTGRETHVPLRNVSKLEASGWVVAPIQ